MDILNEKTIKKGTEFYEVRLVAYKKDFFHNNTWHFWFQKVVADHEPSPRISFCVKEYLVGYSLPVQVNTSLEFIDYEVSHCNRPIQAFRIEGNKEPIITVSIFKSSNVDEYVYLCTDIRAAIKALKSEAFKVKGNNETTKRRRIRMWKELIRQWTKTQFRDNFYTSLS